MKDEEIIALAEKSGCEGNQLTHDGAYNFVFTEDTLIAFAKAIADWQKENVLQSINPRTWNKQMSNAWNSNIPNTQKAFDALTDIIRSPESDIDQATRLNG